MAPLRLSKPLDGLYMKFKLKSATPCDLDNIYIYADGPESMAKISTAGCSIYMIIAAGGAMNPPLSQD